MKANKLRNHPLPTHRQLVEEQEERMERMEDTILHNDGDVDEDALEEETGDAEEAVREGTLKG